MSIDELYRTLRELVSDKYRIEMRDGRKSEVVIVPDGYGYESKFPWTSFRGLNLEDALTRAITKLRNPEMDYRAVPTCTDPEGFLWLASKESIYGERHTRLFLKE